MVQVNPGDHPFRNKRDDDQVESSYQRYAGENLINVIRCSFSRTDTRDKSTVLSHVVSNFVGVKDNRYVEVCEEDNSDCIQQRVERLAPSQRVHHGSEVAIVSQSITDRLRQRQD